MVIRVSPGAKQPHERHGHKKSAKRNGTQLTESIRASGATPRKQAGHRSVPDQGAPKTRKRPCNAGAIHTGRRGLQDIVKVAETGFYSDLTLTNQKLAKFF